MSNHKFFCKGQVPSVVTPVPLVLVDTNALTGTNALVHNLTSVPAGALIVLTATSQDSQTNAAVSSSPSITWTKRADATSPQSPNAEIYTAVFTAGGSIDITMNWGAGRVQTSVTYVFTGQETTLGGASAVATGQSTASVPISTSKTNSVIICVSSNWNAPTIPLTYRLSPVKVLEFRDPANGTYPHYYYNAATVAQYTVGYSAPSDVDLGTSTAVYEVRSGTGGGGPGPDTTAPSAPVLNSPGKTNVSVGLQWTAAEDLESGIEGYEIFRGATPTTVTTSIGTTTSGLTFNATGLTPGTTYSFKVRATNTVGLFTDSNVITVTTDTVTTTTTTTTTTTQIGPTTTTTTTTFINQNPFTFTALTGDYKRYWGGQEFWGAGTGAISVIDQDGNSFGPAHRYRRYNWLDWETDTQGVYRFEERLLPFFTAAIANKQLCSFGLITVYPCGNPAESFHRFNTGGAWGSAVSPYPLYLHNLMQAETNTKDWISTACNSHWVPNYNSPSYLNRLDQLYLALNNYLTNTVVGGVRLIDAVGYVDIRGVGSWGEWHHGSTAAGNDAQSMINAGTFPTNSTFTQIIDIHRNRFPNKQLVAMFATFDKNHANGAGFDNTRVPAAIGQYAMNNGNAYGDIGIRRDQWGDTAGYYTLIENTSPITGTTTRYLTAPINGEPPGYNAPGGSCNCHMGAFPDQVSDAHQNGSIVGNANYGPAPDTNSMRTGFRTMGCILRLTNGGGTNLTTSTFGVTTNWRNFGVAPQYKKDWRVTFELRQGGSLVWSGVSSLNVFSLKPATSSTAINDSFARPAIAAGQYQLSVRIVDPLNYCEPLQLGIQGRQANGSYILSNVTF